MEEEFAIVDLWAAEAFLVALEANEVILLDMLQRGVKIHQWLLDQVKAQYPIEVEKAKFDYHKAKTCVHGLDYDVKPTKMTQEVGLPISVTTWLYSFYHGKFPGIKLRMERIKDELKNTRTLTSLLGRKRVFFAPWGDELFKMAYAWPTQSCIAEITNAALAKIYYLGEVLHNPWAFPAIDTHDGLAIRCFKKDREKTIEVIKSAFYTPVSKWGKTIVVPVEIGFAPNFNDLDKASTKVYQYASNSSK